MTASAGPTTNADAPTNTATIYSRDELFLGPVHGIALPEEDTVRRATRTSYELNILDGWVRVYEWTDDSGVLWAGESRRKSRVRAVLDAAPNHAEFVARVHLMWVKALKDAGERRQAGAQARALNDALRGHGLALVRDGR